MLRERGPTGPLSLFVPKNGAPGRAWIWIEACLAGSIQSSLTLRVGRARERAGTPP